MAANKEEEKEEAKIDFISNLPIAILLHILSLLPTKDAVATDTLSKHWHNLWKSASLPHLNFNDAATHKKPIPNPEPGHDPKTLFINFVNKLLHQSKNLASVTLSCLESYGSSTINTWLSDACRRDSNIVELEVFVNFDRQDPIELPPWVYTSTSLVVLKLNANVKLDLDHYDACFPSLKVLHISVHNQRDLDLTKRLYSRCPVLENLFLESLMLQERRVRFEVCSSTLKRLRIELTLTETDMLGLYDYKVLIKAENLELLDVSNNFIVRYRFKDLNVLDRANVRIGLPHESLFGQTRAFEFLKGLSHHVKSLSLSGCTISVLCNVLMPNIDFGVISDFTFPAKFACLTNLEVGFRNCYSWTVLPIIMECSPYLEFLALEKEVLDEVEFVCDEWLQRWREPKPVPKCMLNCLKVLGIKGFQGKQYELTVVKFLLGNAVVLEKMVICSPPLSSDEETMLISETLFRYPRGSKDCQIIFFSDS